MKMDLVDGASSEALQTALDADRERAKDLRQELACVERRIAYAQSVQWEEHRKRRQAAIEAMGAGDRRAFLAAPPGTV